MERGTCYLCLITFCRAIKSSIIVLLLALIAVIQRWSWPALAWPVLADLGPPCLGHHHLRFSAGQRCWNSLYSLRLWVSGFIYGSVIMIKHLSSARLILILIFILMLVPVLVLFLFSRARLFEFNPLRGIHGG